MKNFYNIAFDTRAMIEKFWFTEIILNVQLEIHESSVKCWSDLFARLLAYVDVYNKQETIERTETKLLHFQWEVT